VAEPKHSIQYYLKHFQGSQQGIGGTSGFRGTQVEKHWSIGLKVGYQFSLCAHCYNLIGETEWQKRVGEIDTFAGLFKTWFSTMTICQMLLETSIFTCKD